MHLPQRVSRSQKTTLCSQVSTSAFFKGSSDLTLACRVRPLTRPAISLASRVFFIVETCKVLSSRGTAGFRGLGDPSAHISPCCWGQEGLLKELGKLVGCWALWPLYAKCLASKRLRQEALSDSRVLNKPGPYSETFLRGKTENMRI